MWGVGPPEDSIRFRRFDAADQPLTGEKLVSTSSDEEELPSVAALPDGSLVVAWESGVGDSVAAQRLEADGDKLGSQIVVATSGGQPDVAVAADGTFVVAWASAAGVKARRFDANGAPLTAAV